MTSRFNICEKCNGDGVVVVEVMRLLPQNYSRFAEPDYVEQEIECERCDGKVECTDD